MSDVVRQRGVRAGWSGDPTARLIIAIGLGFSMLLGLTAFASWTWAVGGFADDSYLWWTMAGFLLPVAVAWAVVRTTRRRPELAPAVGAGILLVGLALLAMLLE